MTEKNQYFLYYFDSQFHPLIHWKTDTCVYALSKNLTWLALNNSHGFELISLIHNLSIKQLIIDFIPEQIISLDEDHGVVIYKQNNLNFQETYFRFFNRRGNWYDTYIVSSSLHKVIHHPALNNTFLAREKCTNNLLLINFNPFYISRIPLNFRADYYLAAENSFICASEQGEIAF